MVCKVQKSAQCHIDRAKCMSYNVPQKLTTTVCSLQKESSGGKINFYISYKCRHAASRNSESNTKISISKITGTVQILDNHKPGIFVYDVNEHGFGALLYR